MKKDLSRQLSLWPRTLRGRHRPRSRDGTFATAPSAPRKRAWNAIIKPQDFRLLSGQGRAQRLPVRQPAGAITASAGIAAIGAFGEGYVEEIGGAFVSVGVACLDALTPEALAELPIQYMDGRHDNWFLAAESHQLSLSPEGEPVPPCAGAALNGGAFAVVNGHEAMTRGQFARFGGRDLEHAPGPRAPVRGAATTPSDRRVAAGARPGPSRARAGPHPGASTPP